MRKTSLYLRDILSQNIKNYRKEKGLSQEDLAFKCNLHRTYMGSIERCERNVTLSTLDILARTLDTTVPKLLTRKDDNEK